MPQPSDPDTATGQLPAGGGFFRRRRRPQEDAFRVVRRGYAPEDVDERLDALTAELEDSRAQLQAAWDERDAARQELAFLRQRLAGSRPHGDGPHGDPDLGEVSRGPVADRLIRMAQREALVIRANASREASTLVDGARAHAAREHAELRRRLDAQLAGLRKQITDSLKDLHALDRPSPRPAIHERTVPRRNEGERPAGPAARVDPADRPPLRPQDIR